MFYELKKRWKPRLLWWVIIALLFFITFRATKDPLLIVLWALVGVLFDEVIKEGYMFRIRDLGKLTHESIVAVLAFILAALLFWRNRGKEK